MMIAIQVYDVRDTAVESKYTGAGEYLAALAPDGAVLDLERCLSVGDRAQWVTGRRYRGKPTDETRRRIAESRAQALAEREQQIAAFRARHAGAEVVMCMGSCYELVILEEYV